MKVMIVSRALLVRSYRGKLTELARLGVRVTAVVPSEWREAGGPTCLEMDDQIGYELIQTSVRWAGHFHLHYYPELNRLLRDIRPDLLHLDEEPYNLSTYLGARAACGANVPSLFFSWQNLVRRYPPPFSGMERSVYRSVVHALAGTQEVARVLRHKGYAGALSVVPQFGVDPEMFRPGAYVESPFTIGFLNRLIPGKAPLMCVRALALLPKDTRLQIVGDGPLRKAVLAEIDRLALGERVSVEPRVPSALVPEILRSLDAVVLPSVTTRRWKEQFGRIIIEAMASGVPVVGSDSGEIPRVIGDGGLIVPEGDVRALARALRQLYEDRDLGRRLGERGRRRVLEHFTHERVAELSRAAYERALGGTY